MTTAAPVPGTRASFRHRLGAALTFATLLIPAGSNAAIAGPRTGDREMPLSSTTVEYRPSDEVIANPSRGFYKHSETHFREDGTGYTPLDPQTLRSYREQGITRVLRVFYLEKFADRATLDQELLDLVEADFDTAREGGISVIVRFAYAQGGTWPYSPPYADAPVQVVLGHIDQLGPVLRANSDVIATVQAGFIGLWGEWYYTDHFASDPADPGALSEEDRENRTAVVNALLHELPKDRTVQVRTMLSKQTIFGVPAGETGAISEEQAFDGSDLSRIGHHNDCFLASPDDYGTFLSSPVSLDEDYLEADTRFVPMGGETCAVNAPRSAWPSAATLMERYHFSHLNRDYHQDVLDSWGPDGITETSKRLGYRFVLDQSTVVKGAPQQGTTAVVKVDVTNEGWAAPYNERPVQLVLHNANGAWTVPFVGAGSGAVDARDWAPGTSTTISAEACGLPAGRYDAYLHLPSSDESLRQNPDFSIQAANAGTWVPARGWNNLQQQLDVSTDAATRNDCTGLAAQPL